MKNKLSARSKVQDEENLSKARDIVRALSPQQRKEMMARLPAFISYPRTGSQWLEAVMEHYFDRPCLRERRATLIGADRTDWLFFHDHDIDLKLTHDNVLYLYRSPSDTVYSYLIYKYKASRRKSWWGRWRQRGEEAITETKVNAMARAYRAHLEKWLLSPQRARTAVRYEMLREKPLEEFSRICDHFALPFDPERVKKTFEETSRARMVEVAVKKVALDQSLLSESYKMGRKEFETRFGAAVRQTVIAPELAPFFSYLDEIQHEKG